MRILSLYKKMYWRKVTKYLHFTFDFGNPLLFNKTTLELSHFMKLSQRSEISFKQAVFLTKLFVLKCLHKYTQNT